MNKGALHPCGGLGAGSASAETGNTGQAGGGSRVRVLLVDDDPGVRSVFGAGLRQLQLEVDMAADGDAAWEALCTKPYDLLITDHLMPRLTGLELLRRLRAVRVDLPCILISGDLPEADEDLAACVQPGCTLEKPITLALFLTTVKALLARHPAGASAFPPDRAELEGYRS